MQHTGLWTMACIAVRHGVVAWQAGCVAAHMGGCGAGRSTERPVLSEEEIERNVQGIKRILEQLIVSGNGAGPAPLILNNLVSEDVALKPVYFACNS